MTACNVVAHPNASAPAFSAGQLSLIRRTCAQDCTNDEFDLFVSGYCKTLGLNPLKKQIFAIVYSKDDATKRKMSVVISIDGYRVIAARTGNYRPGRITFEADASLKDANSNPHGLISATASVHMFSHGSWHEVEATAYWDEYAPLKTEGEEGFEWVETGEFWPDTGKPKKKKKPLGNLVRKLDATGKWATMPRLMLGKVAEAAALRRAWPDDFSNVYAEEEVDRSRLEPDEVLLPSEAAAKGDVEERMARIGAGQTILLDLMDGPASPLQPVPIGQFADKVCAFIAAHREEPSQIRAFSEKNRFGMREFWALQPGDALDLKKKIEDAINNPPAEVVEGDAQ